MFRKLMLVGIAMGTLISTAGAQAVDATKETGKSISEGAQEGADNAKAAFQSGGDKAVTKAKAQVHKAKAKYHRHKAKKAASATVH